MFPKWQGLFPYSRTTEQSKLFTQNIKYKKYNTIYLYIIRILNVSTKCWQEDDEQDGERGLGGEQYCALGKMQDRFNDFIVKSVEEGGDVDDRLRLEQIRGDFSMAVVKVHLINVWSDRCEFGLVDWLGSAPAHPFLELP